MCCVLRKLFLNTAGAFRQLVVIVSANTLLIVSASRSVDYSSFTFFFLFVAIQRDFNRLKHKTRSVRIIQLSKQINISQLVVFFLQ